MEKSVQIVYYHSIEPGKIQVTMITFISQVGILPQALTDIKSIQVKAIQIMGGV